MKELKRKCRGDAGADFQALVHDRREILLLLFGAETAQIIPADAATCCFGSDSRMIELARSHFHRKGVQALNCSLGESGAGQFALR
jgi:hypothetical protein